LRLKARYDSNLDPKTASRSLVYDKVTSPPENFLVGGEGGQFMKTLKYCRNIALGFSAVAALVCVAANAAPFSDQPDPAVVKVGAATVVHHKFALAPGGSKTINLPVSSEPVQLLLSFSLNNGGTSTPSELAYAVVNEDAQSGNVTWIGTSSNGTTAAGTTLDGGNIATVGSTTITANRQGTGSPHGSLVFTQGAGGDKGHYIVTLTYFSAK
jgi:hypothetical protein